MASGKLPPDTKSIVVCHVIDKRSVIVVAVFKGGEYAHTFQRILPRTSPSSLYFWHMRYLNSSLGYGY